jgi:PST family polysaccharide transporter
MTGLLPGRDPRIMRACFHPEKRDLPARVARGAAWMGSLIVVRALVTVGATAILARVLRPTDYGYIAMATVVVELAAMLCIFGLPAIIIQAPRLSRLDLDTGFWFTLGLGVVVATAVVGGAWVAAEAFREPALAPILWAMSLLIVFEEVSAVHEAIALRLLLFKVEAVSQLGGLFARVAVSLWLAFAGLGVWSLVLGSVAGRAAQAALLWYLIPYVPRFRFSRRFLAGNWRAGASYFGSAAVGFVMSNVDNATVGRAFGARELGYYQTAFALPEELRSRLSVALQRVLFPAYALVQSEHSMFREGVLKSLSLFAAIAMPMGVGMAVLARPIVRVLYGEQWLPVVPLLQVVAIVGIVRALYALLVNIYKAKGRPDLEFKIGLFLVPMFVVAVLAGSRFGAMGVAVGVLLFNVVLLASTARALKLIELDAAETLAALVPATIAAAVMGAGLLALDAAHVVPRGTALAELTVSVAIGVLLFFAALCVVSRRTVRELWAMRRFLRAHG